MTIQQQYYTSWHNHKTGQTGFQIKAESEGLTTDIAQTLKALIGYRIPASADTSSVETHPIALRYYVHNNLAVLISSQSSGQDELGRDGNFFAHSIVATPQDIAYPLAPIFYWQSPFWVNEDKSDQTKLPSLEQLNAEVTFDFDAVWNFLNQKNHISWFKQLLCAVIDQHQSQRRIIILDDTESVALWIAALCTVLPPSYSYFLTFSTYHHDPGTAPFDITGTTTDSNFRCTRDEYISYFILNAFEECISEAPPSDYTDYIIERLYPEKYEEEVLEFFSWLERLDSQPQVITRLLDNYINFYSSAIVKLVTLQPSKLIAAINPVITTISSKQAIGTEDIADIRAGCETLGNSLQQNSDREILNEYTRTIQILKKYDPCFADTLPKVLNVVMLLLLNRRLDEAKILSDTVTQLYSAKERDSIINNPENIQNWASQLSNNDVEQITIFWKFVGKDFKLTDATQAPLQAILIKSFTALQNQVTTNHLQQAANIKQAIAAIRGAECTNNNNFLITVAGEYQRQNLTSPILKWIYYALVENLTLPERARLYWQYWKTFEQQAPDLYSYELQRDLLKNVSQEIVQTVRNWADSFNGYSDSSYRIRFVNESVTFLGSPQFLELSTLNRRELSLELLAEDSLVADIDGTLYSQIVDYLLSQAKICKVDSKTLKVYEKLVSKTSGINPYDLGYQTALSPSHLQISWQIQSIIKGAIDLTKGRLQDATIPELYRYFESVSSDKYESEAKELFDEFFANRNIDPHEHLKLVRGVYIKRHREDFWKIYWSHFHSSLVEKEQIMAIVYIIDLWFRYSGDMINEHPYVLPEFFAELPNILEEIQASKNYRKIERSLKSELSRKDWYPVIEKYFQKSRKGFLGNFF
jgi:GTPase-associated protein 1, N-terminal domain type 2/GTPase-associated protein 1, middle domain